MVPKEERNQPKEEHGHDNPPNAESPLKNLNQEDIQSIE